MDRSPSGLPRRDSAVVDAFKSAHAESGKSRCAVCRWKPPKGLAALHQDTASMLHAHHVVPLACGGDDNAKNLVLLCPTHHAVAHKLGRMTRPSRARSRMQWDGPTTPTQLLREMRMMEKEPEAFAAYIAGGRDYAGLMRQDEEAEAASRRRKFTLSTSISTTSGTSILDKVG